MTENMVTTRDALIRRQPGKGRPLYKRWWLWCAAAMAIIIITFTSMRLISIARSPVEPPETARILEAQKSMGNFGILIPAYLPNGFDREGVEIAVETSNPTREPAVNLVYRGKDDLAVFLHQWVPVAPQMVTLTGSRPIQTKWGKGWLLTQTDTLICVWVDIGPLRVSLSTHNLDRISREQMVLMADTLGLASNLQAYSFVTEIPDIQNVNPPPPFEVGVNSQGIQELNLTITPGGYSPMRFAVRKDIPVKINFRALGEVGCGNTLIFPVESGDYLAVTLTKDRPLQVLEFTPHTTGDKNFNCSTQCFQGIMTVRE